VVTFADTPILLRMTHAERRTLPGENSGGVGHFYPLSSSLLTRPTCSAASWPQYKSQLHARARPRAEGRRCTPKHAEQRGEEGERESPGGVPKILRK